MVMSSCISRQHRMVTPIWLALLLLSQAFVPGICGLQQQEQQSSLVPSLQDPHAQPVVHGRQAWRSTADVAAGIPAVDYGGLAPEAAAAAAEMQGGELLAAAAAAAATPPVWEAMRQQAQQRRQQFQKHATLQQQPQVQQPMQQGLAGSLDVDSRMFTKVGRMMPSTTDLLSNNVLLDSAPHIQQPSKPDVITAAGSGLAAAYGDVSSSSGAFSSGLGGVDNQHAVEGIQQQTHIPYAETNMVGSQELPAAAAEPAATNIAAAVVDAISSSRSSSEPSSGLPAAGTATLNADSIMFRSLTEVGTHFEQPRPSAFGDGVAAIQTTTAAEQLLEPGGGAPTDLTGDMTAAAGAVDPAAAGGVAAGGSAAAAGGGAAAAVGSVAIAAAAAEGPSITGTDMNTAVTGTTSSADSSSSSREGIATPPLWKPRVLEAPAPKWPRLYATVAPPAPTLPTDLAPAAVSALLAAAHAAKTPQGISISGIPGLTLEDKILLARLAGHVIQGSFDTVGQMDPSSTAYWENLDAQIDKHTQVKHMFESIWYKCSKLNADLLTRTSSAYDMEVEALQHILAWLGFPEKHLPRPGEFADFDDLVTLLDGVGAKARLVTDPVPFLETTRPPLDRNGMPMLIHMTFKDKGQFARHHLLSLASWAKENPDHAILMYDDADLRAYLSTYDPSVLDLYGSLKTAVERSDLWRYVVMCKHGGVYTDADTLCVRPIQEWNKENQNDAEAVFGVEDVFKRDPNGGNSGWGVSQGRFGIQFEQWTLAGAPNHPVYCNMHNFISQRIIDEASKQSPVATTESENWSILHRTGPHVWTDSVLNWMHDQGIGFHEALVPGGRLVANNTRIMPGETFGCAAHFFSPAARLEEVYAMHMFRGVWRKRLDSGGGEVDRHHIRLGF